MLVLRREDPARNMARFYCLSLEASLFGETMLVTRWGRIGTYGRRRATPYVDASAAEAALDVQTRLKIRRGYQRLGLASV